MSAASVCVSGCDCFTRDGSFSEPWMTLVTTWAWLYWPSAASVANVVACSTVVSGLPPSAICTEPAWPWPAVPYSFFSPV